METLVSCEGVLQLTAEQVGDAHQFREKTVDVELRLAATAVAEPVVRARPPGFAKYNATTESALGESLEEAGSSGSGGGAISAATVAVARFDEGARPPRIAKNSATSKGDAGSSWSRDGGATSAAVAAADVRSVAEVRPLGIAKQSATSESESELVESSDEEFSPRERGQLWTAQKWAEWRRAFEANFAVG